MKKYIIRANELSWEGFYAHPCDAINAALEQYPGARRISARPA